MTTKEYDAAVKEQAAYEQARAELIDNENIKLAGLIADISRSSKPDNEKMVETKAARAQFVKATAKPYGEVLLEQQRAAEILDYQKNGSSEKQDIVLDDDIPSTIAHSFIQWSKVIHHYNTKDGWTICVDNKYQRVEDPTELEFYIRKFIRCFTYRITIKGEEQVRTPGHKHQTSGFIKSICEWLRDDPAIHLLPGQTAPCSLDGKLDTKAIVATNNKLVNIDTFETYPLTPQYYTLNYLPYDWEPEQRGDKWDVYLKETFSHNGVPDDDMILLACQWFGYSLLGHDQSQQKFMLLYGEASTGKTVFLDTLTRMLGDVNVSSVPLDKFDEPHLFASTYGKLLNATDEVAKHIETTIETTLKAHTGGGKVQYKEMYRKSFAAYPTAKIIIATNEKPSFKDTSEGIWRRLLLIPFDNVVSEKHRNMSLIADISANEMSYILKWAMQGAASLRQFGFVKPARMMQAAKNYKREALPEIVFFNDNYEDGSPLYSCDFVTVKEMRDAYVQFCLERGNKPKSDQKLARTRKKVFSNTELAVARIDGRAQRYFKQLVRKELQPDSEGAVQPENDYLTF